MKIVIVAPEAIPVPPILGGSVEITVLAIAKKMAKRHSVSIISRAHRKYPSHSVIGGVHIYRVATGSPLQYLGNVKKFLKGRSFDLIQVDNRPKFIAPLKAAFPRAKVSLFLHSLTFVSSPYASKETVRKGFAKADVIIANSTSLKNRLISRVPSSKSKIRKVWLGVDTSRFTSASQVKTSGSFNLLFAGRLIPRKGVPVILKAAKIVQRKSVRPVKIIIAGGSTNTGYSKKMRTLARQLGVKAEFLGTVPHRRMHQVYRRAHVFLCPSQKHEAFGLVNVEAMASGVPVIASDNGGIKEIVQHNRTGILIKNYSRPQAFADAITRLMSNKPLLQSMKKNARRVALQRFSWSATAKKLSSIYSSKV